MSSSSSSCNLEVTMNEVTKLNYTMYCHESRHGRCIWIHLNLVVSKMPVIIISNSKQMIANKIKHCNIPSLLFFKSGHEGNNLIIILHIGCFSLEFHLNFPAGLTPTYTPNDKKLAVSFTSHLTSKAKTREIMILG